MTTKPYAPLIGSNGNTMNLLAIASKALKRAGQREQATEMQQRVFACGSYGEALMIMCEYVDTAPPDEEEEEN